MERQEAEGSRESERPCVPRHLGSANAPPPRLSVFESLSFFPGLCHPSIVDQPRSLGAQNGNPSLEVSSLPSFGWGSEAALPFPEQPSPHTTPTLSAAQAVTLDTLAPNKLLWGQ